MRVEMPWLSVVVVEIWVVVEEGRSHGLGCHHAIHYISVLFLLSVSQLRNGRSSASVTNQVQKIVALPNE